MLWTVDTLADNGHNFKALIFDFGGVLIHLNPIASFEAMSRVCNRPITISNMAPDDYEVFIAYEKGTIKTENFLWHFQRSASPTPYPRDLIDAWNAMLGEMIWEHLELLLQLRKKYKVCLLSNNNDLHLSTILGRLATKHGIVDFNKRYFDEVFYSQELHMRKPDQEIYVTVSNAIGEEGSNILFIDDHITNVEASVKSGWHAVHHPRNSSLNYCSCLL